MRFHAGDDDAVAVESARRSAKRIRGGSPQQEAFWSELLEGAGHVVLEARAGTGKSSSCREGMWRLIDANPRAAIRYCCFNKAIADEFALDCPSGVEVGTMHRFGNLVLSRSFGAKINTDKTYSLIDQLGGQSIKRYVRRAISTLVSLAKNHGIHPNSSSIQEDVAKLLSAFDVETYHNDQTVIEYAALVLIASAETTAIVDFDDMLWLPVMHKLRFPGVDYLFIDECQDLNPLQHEMALSLAESGRAVVVGDPYQAIYGWRGAATESIADLRRLLDATTMPLTVTWRCPRSHVARARQLVPDFEAAPGAIEGWVESGPRDLIDGARPGDLVICRANAPIISACLGLITQLKPAYVRGRAIEQNLMRTVARLDGSATIREFTRDLADWLAHEVSRLDAKEGAEAKIEQVYDQADCLEAIAASCRSPMEIPTAIKHLFDDQDGASRVTFSSIHRAKGSEAERVYFIDLPDRIDRKTHKPAPPWEADQRRNLRYVALTRSLNTLSLVS